MASDRKIIYVYDSFSEDTPRPWGTLYVDVIRGGESYSLQYDDAGLKSSGLSIALDPDLQAFPGSQYPSGKGIFGIFSDASPDRWGQMLMRKRERILAEKEGRKP